MFRSGCHSYLRLGFFSDINLVLSGSPDAFFSNCLMYYLDPGRSYIIKTRKPIRRDILGARRNTATVVYVSQMLKTQVSSVNVAAIWKWQMMPYTFIEYLLAIIGSLCMLLSYSMIAVYCWTALLVASHFVASHFVFCQTGSLWYMMSTMMSYYK